MDILFAVPYTVRIIVSLLAILVFQKLTKRLSAALIAGILLLAVWTGHSPASIATVAGDRLLSLETLFLAFVISGVVWLSTLMSESGIMKDLVVCLKSRLSKRAILAALPAVIGLLPMPAGALFSCPLVDDADSNTELSPQQKTEINYWFRHVWEFWWPMYPGMLLAVDLSGLPIWQFILLMCPMSAGALFAGYLFLLRKTPKGGPGRRDPDDKPFLSLIAPTIAVVVVYGFLLVTFPGLARINKYLPLAIGIACGLATMQLQRPAALRTWIKAVTSPRSLSLVLIIMLAKVYGAFIEARLSDGTLLMETVRLELDHYGIPALLLVILIPFISGLSTGITVGYIGASFPVVLSLAGPGTGELFSTIAIGYACGFIGMMLSPIHVCLIVTNDYFKTGMTESLYALLRPAALLFVYAAAYAGLWRWLA